MLPIVPITRSHTFNAYAISPTWEPLGGYGVGFNDVEYHDNLVARLGTSLAAAPNTDIDRPIAGNPENTLLRLSDGTDLTTVGALGPGTTLRSTDWYLAAVDAGLKYRGHSLSAEYFYRYLDDFKIDSGAPTRSSLNDRGGFLYAAINVVPKTFELTAKTGFVSGAYGSSEEYSGGFNWYLNKTRFQRLAFEAVHYNGSPAENSLTPYRAFYSGTALQAEYYVQF